MTINSRADQLAFASDLVDVPKLIAAYYEERRDSEIAEERVIFGTSGHRGSSFTKTFNEWHILAITQAIVRYRKERKINGPPSSESTPTLCHSVTAGGGKRT